MGANGTILEQGDPRELKAIPDSHLNDLLSTVNKTKMSRCVCVCVLKTSVMVKMASHPFFTITSPSGT